MKKGILFLVAVSILGFIPIASAGLIVTDPSATTGTVDYSVSGKTATVHFAVFSPGDFTGVDASQGYVYAYQVENTSTSGAISAFSIYMQPGSGAAAYGSDADTDGVVEPYQMIPGVDSESMKVIFDEADGYSFLLPGQKSYVALFTSPYSYEYVSSSVMNSGLGDTVNNAMPSPIPEPATISFLGLAGLALIRKNRK